MNDSHSKPALEGHALEIYCRLLRDPRMGGSPVAAAREAIRLARVFNEAVERAESGRLEEFEAADPYAELDDAYSVNLPPHHHLNLMSRLMPKPGGRGELVLKPNLDKALEECKKARRMTPQHARPTTNSASPNWNKNSPANRPPPNKNASPTKRPGRTCCRKRLESLPERKRGEGCGARGEGKTKTRTKSASPSARCPLPAAPFPLPHPLTPRPSPLTPRIFS